MISILIPFKNTASFFKECLDSILAQSHSDFEIIAVDDQSEDASLNIIKAYSDKASNLFQSRVNRRAPRTTRRVRKMTEIQNKSYLMALLSGVAYKDPEEASKTFKQRRTIYTKGTTCFN